MTAQPSTDGGFLVRFLRDPAAFAEAAAAAASELFARVGTELVVVASLVAAVVVALWLARRADARALARGARTIEILAPPEPEAAGAGALWANLHDIVGVRRRAPWRSRRHIAFEYTWREEGLRIQLWLPASVPPELVERAVEAAWPGARVL